MGKSRLSRTQQLEPVIDNTDRDEKLERLFKEEIKETPKAKKTTKKVIRYNSSYAEDNVYNINKK